MDRSTACSTGAFHHGAQAVTWYRSARRVSSIACLPTEPEGGATPTGSISNVSHPTKGLSVPFHLDATRASRGRALGYLKLLSTRMLQTGGVYDPSGAKFRRPNRLTRTR